MHIQDWQGFAVEAHIAIEFSNTFIKGLLIHVRPL